MILYYVILLGNLMLPVHGNVFDYLPKKPCDFLVVGVSSYSSYLDGAVSGAEIKIMLHLE